MTNSTEKTNQTPKEKMVCFSCGRTVRQLHRTDTDGHTYCSSCYTRNVSLNDRNAVIEEKNARDDRAREIAKELLGIEL